MPFKYDNPDNSIKGIVGSSFTPNQVAAWSQHLDVNTRGVWWPAIWFYVPDDGYDYYVTFISMAIDLDEHIYPNCMGYDSSGWRSLDWYHGEIRRSVQKRYKPGHAPLLAYPYYGYFGCGVLSLSKTYRVMITVNGYKLPVGHYA